MKTEIHMALACAVIVVAACGSPGSEATTTTIPAQTTSEAVATTTTTTAPETTTSTSAEADNSELMALIGTIAPRESITSARIEGAIELTGINEEATGLSEIVILFNLAL